jgi:hypothetical protein
MVARQLSWLVLVMSLSILGLSVPSLAVKVDLSAFLAGVPRIGDYRLFARSDGKQSRIAVVELSLWKKGWRVVAETETTGFEPILRESFVIPGKKVYLGDTVSPPLAVLLARPKLTLKSRFRPGRPQRFRAKGVALIDGVPIGPGRWGGSFQFAGFELLDTPARSYPLSARLDYTLSLIIVDVYAGDVIAGVSEGSSWYTEDLGYVAESQRIVTLVNGTVVEDTGVVETWLTSGVIGGVPYP